MLEDAEYTKAALDAAAMAYHNAMYRGGDGQLDAARQYIRALEVQMLQMRQRQHATDQAARVQTAA